MANRLFPSVIRCVNRETKLIAGSFAPNGASNPVVSSNTGQGYKSITFTGGTGQWTVTLQENYPALVGAFLSLGLGSVAGTDVQFGAISIKSGTPTVVINAYNTTTGSATNISAASNNIIYFALLVKNSGFPTT